MTTTRSKIKTRELGLLLAQRLFGLVDLHYGLWDEDLPVTLANLAIAQRRHTDFLLGALRELGAGPLRVLDVGCGTGMLLAELCALGHDVEGVSPTSGLTRLALERLARAGRSGVRLFECRFEDFPCAERVHHYDALIFSESFQYVGMLTALEHAEEILLPGGHLMIFDFFRTRAHGDGGTADDTIGGGHPIAAFYEAVARSRFTILRDKDVTIRAAPTLTIANEIMMCRLLPACEIVAQDLSERRPWLFQALRLLAKRKIEKLHLKYFSGFRTPETFSRYKTYRLIICRAATA